MRFLNNNTTIGASVATFTNLDNDEAAQRGDNDISSGSGASGNLEKANRECNSSSDCASGWRCIGAGCVPPENTPGEVAGDSGNDQGCGGNTANQKPEGGFAAISTGGGGGSTGGGGGGGGACGSGTGSGGGSSPGVGSGSIYLPGPPSSGVCDAPGAGGGPSGVGCGGGSGGSGSSYPAISSGTSSSGGGSGGGGGGGACCGSSRCCKFRSFGTPTILTHCSCGICPPEDRCQKFCADHSAATGSSGAGCQPGSECDECSSCERVGFSGTTDVFQCKTRPGGPCHCPEGVKCAECQRCGSSGTCESAGSDCSPPPPPSPPQPPGGGGGGGGGGECAESCTTFTVCGESPSCPPGSRQTGSISTPDKTCVLCEKCTPANDDCGPEPCDCNCENDCPDCFICNAEGECEPDPQCVEPYYFTIGLFKYIQNSYGYIGCDPREGCGSGCRIHTSTIAYFAGQLKAEGDLGPSFKMVKSGEPFNAVVTCPVCPSSLGCFSSELVQRYKAVRSDGVTPAKVSYGGRSMFDVPYSYSKQYYCTVHTYVPVGEEIVITAYGDTLEAARASAEEQREAVSQSGEIECDLEP